MVPTYTVEPSWACQRRRWQWFFWLWSRAMRHTAMHRTGLHDTTARPRPTHLARDCHTPM